MLCCALIAGFIHNASFIHNDAAPAQVGSHIMAPTWLTPPAAQADSVNSPLAISIIWGIYQIVPYALVLFYWLVSKGVMLQYMCRLGLLVTFVSGAAAVGLMWGLYPPSYNFAKVQPFHTVLDKLVGTLQPLELAYVLRRQCRVPVRIYLYTAAAHASTYTMAGGAVRLACLHRGGCIRCSCIRTADTDLTTFCCAGCSTVQFLLRCSTCWHPSSHQ